MREYRLPGESGGSSNRSPGGRESGPPARIPFGRPELTAGGRSAYIPGAARMDAGSDRPGSSSTPGEPRPPLVPPYGSESRGVGQPIHKEQTRRDESRGDSEKDTPQFGTGDQPMPREPEVQTPQSREADPIEPVGPQQPVLPTEKDASRGESDSDGPRPARGGRRQEPIYEAKPPVGNTAQHPDSEDQGFGSPVPPASHYDGSSSLPTPPRVIPVSPPSDNGGQSEGIDYGREGHDGSAHSRWDSGAGSPPPDNESSPEAKGQNVIVKYVSDKWQGTKDRWTLSGVPMSTSEAHTAEVKSAALYRRVEVDPVVSVKDKLLYGPPAAAIGGISALGVVDARSAAAAMIGAAVIGPMVTRRVGVRVPPKPRLVTLGTGAALGGASVAEAALLSGDPRISGGALAAVGVGTVLWGGKEVYLNIRSRISSRRITKDTDRLSKLVTDPTRYNAKLADLEGKLKNLHPVTDRKKFNRVYKQRERIIDAKERIEDQG